MKILIENYLQHADHYLRRFNELSEKIKETSVDKSEQSLSSEEKKNQIFKDLQIKYYLSSASLRSIFILSNSNSFLASPLSILPEGNFSF